MRRECALASSTQIGGCTAPLWCSRRCRYQCAGEHAHWSRLCQSTAVQTSTRSAQAQHSGTTTVTPEIGPVRLLATTGPISAQAVRGSGGLFPWSPRKRNASRWHSLDRHEDIRVNLADHAANTTCLLLLAPKFPDAPIAAAPHLCGVPPMPCRRTVDRGGSFSRSATPAHMVSKHQ